MKKIVIILLLLSHFSFGQFISGEEFDENNILTWNAETKDKFEGVYFFGFSELESQLTLSIAGDKVCAQLRSYEWVNDENGELTGWQARYKNYTNVQIKGSKFFSDQSNGEFVLYNNKRGLKLESPPVQMGDEGDYEVGLAAQEDAANYHDGKYIETIFEIVAEDVLRAMRLQDLQIMRNEIFARYGYIFISGGKMDTYFNQQDWYVGTNDNVDKYLTEIEKINIANIRKVEHGM